MVFNWSLQNVVLLFLEVYYTMKPNSVKGNGLWHCCCWNHTIFISSIKSENISYHTITVHQDEIREKKIVSHTTYVVCMLICIHKWRDLQFKFDSERQIFCATFQGSCYLLSWCFLFYQKMCTLFQKIQFRVCFLKMFRPLKGWYVLF